MNGGERRSGLKWNRFLIMIRDSLRIITAREGEFRRAARKLLPVEPTRERERKRERERGGGMEERKFDRERWPSDSLVNEGSKGSVYFMSLSPLSRGGVILEAIIASRQWNTRRHLLVSTARADTRLASISISGIYDEVQRVVRRKGSTFSRNSPQDPVYSIRRSFFLSFLGLPGSFSCIRDFLRAEAGRGRSVDFLPRKGGVYEDRGKTVIVSGDENRKWL